MNKNLKKVISAVAALSLSATSIAAFAASFPDVADTESYAQAVQELSALGVISGYDDGTFQPDNLVTRAEISKMIVDALAEGDQAAGSSYSSNFADVSNAGSGGHWATGYINQGVNDGWIAGYDDNSFGPDDNVTYVQAQKMLVSALGYETYAQARGGWPAGYKLYASSLNITSGVQGVTSDDQQLTRAQVAQMIDNAMDAPLVIIDGIDYDAWGNQLPNLVQKNGEGKDYQTLFTNYHDAYKVYGRVTATSKDSNNSLDTDKVAFRVEKADNFDDEYVKSTDERDSDDMYYGDTNAVNMLNVYSQALIQKNDDDEYTILSIVPAAANKTVELLADDVDDSKSDVDNGVIYFYPTGTTRGSVKYSLADDVTYYVNGVSMGSFDSDAYEKYILNDDTAVVTLQKTTSIGSTSTTSKYDTVLITNYATAVVEQVVEKSDSISISFKEQGTGVKTKMTVETDDDQYTYSFTLNGEEIDPTDLQEFDVLSISYDVDAGFADSKFYDVKVSRDTAEGKCTSVSSTNEYTVGGTKYKIAGGMDVSLETSTEYTLYLDAFGRIAYQDELDNSKSYGILKSVYRKNNGDYVAEVITKDGKSAEYDIDYDPSTNKGAMDVADHFNGTVSDSSSYDSGLGKTKTDYANQVVEYKVTNAGKFSVKSFLTAAANTDAEYKENSEKLGSYKVSDATVIIDLSSADANASVKSDDIKVISKDNLKDGTEYAVYAYDKSTNDSVYRFVVITDGIGGIDSTSQLAVFVESGSDSDDDGNDVDTMTLIYNNEKSTYLVDDEAGIDVDDYAEGDLLVFSTNASGEIDKALAVFATKGVIDNSEDFADFATTANTGSILAKTDWTDDLSDADEDNVNIIFGAVVKSGKGYAIAPITGGTIDLEDGNQDITIDSSKTKIYTYNFSQKKKNAGRLVLDNGMMVTPDVKTAHENEDKDITANYDLTNEDVADDVVYAVVRTFDDDEAQEVYLIVND
jgi:hypothetical protein